MRGPSVIFLCDAREPSDDSLRPQVGFEFLHLDRVDPPAAAETLPDLLLRHAPRAKVAGLMLAEAQHKVTRAGTCHIFEFDAVFHLEKLRLSATKCNQRARSDLLKYLLVAT